MNSDTNIKNRMLLAEALSEGKHPPSGVVNWYIKEHDLFMRSSHLAKGYYLGLRDDALHAAIDCCNGKWQTNKVDDFIDRLGEFKKSEWTEHKHLEKPPSQWTNREKHLFYVCMYENKSGMSIPGDRQLLNITGPVVRHKKTRPLSFSERVDKKMLELFQK